MQKKSTFLSLPLEVRLEIYKILIPDGVYVSVDVLPSQWPSRMISFADSHESSTRHALAIPELEIYRPIQERPMTLQILQVCQQVYHEAAPLAYGRTLFCIIADWNVRTCFDAFTRSEHGDHSQDPLYFWESGRSDESVFPRSASPFLRKLHINIPVRPGHSVEYDDSGCNRHVLWRKSVKAIANAIRDIGCLDELYIVCEDSVDDFEPTAEELHDYIRDMVHAFRALRGLDTVLIRVVRREEYCEFDMIREAGSLLRPVLDGVQAEMTSSAPLMIEAPMVALCDTLDDLYQAVRRSHDAIADLSEGDEIASALDAVDIYFYEAWSAADLGHAEAAGDARTRFRNAVEDWARELQQFFNTYSSETEMRHEVALEELFECVELERRSLSLEPFVQTSHDHFND